MIEAIGLTKDFGAIRALAGASFRVEPGAVTALLGPNGSGKTTLMRILTGFFPATSGRARVAGLDVEAESLAVRRRVGYLPEQVALYPEMSVRRFLGFVGEVKGLRGSPRRAAVERVVEACGLGEVDRRLIGTLSRGYRQRVGLAQAMLGDPDVLILDEPMVGLDPRQAMEIRRIITACAGRKTVLLSTHVLSEAAATCSRVVIIDRGRIVAEDTPQALGRRLEGVERTRLKVLGPPAEVVEVVAGVRGVESVAEEGREGNCVVVVVSSSMGDPVRREVVACIVAHGWGLVEMQPVVMTLEDLFVRLVGAAPAEP